MRGERKNYDFTGRTQFFRENYPELKSLYNQVRGYGIIKGYIKKEE